MMDHFPSVCRLKISSPASLLVSICVARRTESVQNKRTTAMSPLIMISRISGSYEYWLSDLAKTSARRSQTSVRAPSKLPGTLAIRSVANTSQAPFLSPALNAFAHPRSRAAIASLSVSAPARAGASKARRARRAANAKLEIRINRINATAEAEKSSIYRSMLNSERGDGSGPNEMFSDQELSAPPARYLRRSR
jgi:hypothetical protein